MGTKGSPRAIAQVGCLFGDRPVLLPAVGYLRVFRRVYECLSVFAGV